MRSCVLELSSYANFKPDEEICRARSIINMSKRVPQFPAMKRIGYKLGWVKQGADAIKDMDEGMEELEAFLTSHPKAAAVFGQMLEDATLTPDQHLARALSDKDLVD